ncbi:hypothetical protein SPI_00014 [Niveomyces insectorum RCEF 264]|uniref:Uncharacterized protein n=1 Tax=Niveomyces insectorum RCEF 264 TaxID=1081102 RepID=A0A167ZR82_9HYPO|nr:hypothetical protein SPI_00014 [Niveomyces insectorum RCEF 264]
MASGMQLSSIMTASSNANTSSPRLPTILPKPISMTLALVTGSGTVSRSHLAETGSSPSSSINAPPHSAPLLPAATFRNRTPVSATAPPLSATLTSGTPNLRLDCTALPPPPPSSAGPHHPVDMGRLQTIYLAHRSPFWAAIASEYGPGANPAVLEQAWRSGGSGSTANSSNTNNGSHHHHQQTATPLTPGTSPDDRDAFYGVKGAQDKTRISAILGIDANPRSPKEREIVRRLEEERVTVPAVA